MNQFFTAMISTDGFGAQYQKIIQTYIYCKIHNLIFCYNPIHCIEHNYNNDNEYINKIENLINLKNNIINLNQTMNVTYLDFNLIVRNYFENNIDKCCESEHMQFIKDCFWENKNKSFFNNDKINVALHIRRPNINDNRIEGTNTPNSYYLNIINIIRKKYENNNKKVLFHIYSQGNILNFKEFANHDVYFHLNENLFDTFIGMVSADILVTSASSLSYIAALISDNEIYYLPFWHNPRKNWAVQK